MQRAFGPRFCAWVAQRICALVKTPSLLIFGSLIIHDPMSFTKEFRGRFFTLQKLKSFLISTL